MQKLGLRESKRRFSVSTNFTAEPYPRPFAVAPSPTEVGAQP
jgi:hypothetical protein